MSVFTSTGVKLYVSAATPATFDAVGYAALTWVEVKEVTTIPEYGPQAQVVTHEPLATGVTEKFGGFINYGSLAVEGAFDASDAGQIILRANALQPNTQIAVKIEYPLNQSDYSFGKCFSGTKNPGSANSMVGTSFNIEFNKPIVEVPA
jgi:hypothetical protein